MKKSLVLAMAMALGVTASAYAANPFSDVPAGHWAYDSINKLAAAGVIEGYGDATFGGDKLMTRYEMAQIVAKAMAKGANVDKLAAEFADELDNLGVRVANLEKKADNVKIAGEVRYRYMTKEKELADDQRSFESDLRSRIWINGQINEDWAYTGMIENTQNFADNSGDEDTEFKRAYVEGKLGGLDVIAGRYNAFFADGYIYDAQADGVEISYGDKIKITAFAGKATDEAGEEGFSYGDYAGGELSGSIGKNLGLKAGYVKFKDIMDNPSLGIDDGIWYVGANYQMGDAALSAMYLKGDASWDNYYGGGPAPDERTDDDGYVIGLSYKGAEADVPGSWGLFANYYDQGAQTYLAHTTDANSFTSYGFKGYGIGGNYAFARNIVGTVVYYDTENKLYDDQDDQRLWADVTFTF